MAKIKRIEVQKGTKKKSIYESELSSYLAMGWQKVNTYASGFAKIK